MPEGPEVRKYADALDEVLSGRVILSLVYQAGREYGTRQGAKP